ncbi:GTPase [Orenia marismortui]|uniref:GTPase n=1 Tax=Orenia marismortui TaxID=46469 RepID=UPI00037EB40B|nr:GTPase domain-containing protein [Orenia marismortui]
MTSALIIGQPNVGKTSFLINFAYYLGIRKLRFMIRQPAGFVSTRTYELEQAYDELTSDKPHKTNNIQSIQLKLPVGKQDKDIRLVDSCGLVDEIHPQEYIRKSMAQTLKELMLSEIVLHIIDLNQLSSNQNLTRIDQEIYDFLKDESGYKILANKLDLDIDKSNLEKLSKIVDKRLLIPISAIYQEGFDKIKLFLLENI